VVRVLLETVNSAPAHEAGAPVKTTVLFSTFLLKKTT
jgi:hypothetical protein